MIVIFQLLLDFLEEVVSHSSVNRMSLSNVAMIMAPNLFLAPKVQPLQAGKSKGNWDIQANIAMGTSNVVRMLIKYHKILWTVSDSGSWLNQFPLLEKLPNIHYFLVWL